jgi:hypothetical protein
VFVPARAGTIRPQAAVPAQPASLATQPVSPIRVQGTPAPAMAPVVVVCAPAQRATQARPVTPVRRATLATRLVSWIRVQGTPAPAMAPVGGVCTCATGYNQSTNCGSCATGYQGYPACVVIPPAPTISGLAYNCSGGLAPGICVSGGNPYPVTFNSTNATSFTVSVTKVSGTGTAGSASGGTISGSPTTFQYYTGSDGCQVDRITVTVTGSGGQATASTDVPLDC